MPLPYKPLLKKEGKCAVCQAECEQKRLFFGGWCRLIIIENSYTDTDYRGKFPEDNHPELVINICPHCGYVAPNIFRPLSSRAVRAVIEILKSDAYKNADNIIFKNKLAKPLYQRAMLSASDPIAKYQNLLRVAWVCDDAGDTENAVLMRKKALVSLNEVIAKRIGFESHSHVEIHLAELMLIKFDLLRRAALFEEFEEEYDKFLQHPLAARDDYCIKCIQEVIEFLHTLNAKKDTGRHRLAEVPPLYKTPLTK